MQNLSFTVPHTAHQTDHNQLQRKKGLFPTPAPTLTRFITFIFQSHLPRVHLAEPHVKFCTMLAGRYPSVPGCEIDLKQYSRPTVECVWFWDIFFLFVRDFLFRCPGLTGSEARRTRTSQFQADIERHQIFKWKLFPVLTHKLPQTHNSAQSNQINVKMCDVSVCECAQM